MNDFKVQLAQKTNLDKPLLESYTVTEKLDGVRCIAIRQGNIWKFFNRSGREITELTDIKKELTATDPDCEVLDGELIVSERTDNATNDFRHTISIVNSQHEKAGVTFHIFDVLERSKTFLEQARTNSYIERRKLLERLNRLVKYMPHLTVVPVLYQGRDVAEIKRAFSSIVANGGEGVMLNNDMKPYSYSRSRALLKVKQQYDNDGVITGFTKGTGQFSDSLGALLVTYHDAEIKIGTGFSNEQRDYIWHNQDSLLGTIVTYRFTSESTNDQGNNSVRFARFVSLRDDKNTVNYEE